MVLIKLGYDKKQKYNWKVLSKEFGDLTYNGVQVVIIHARLWQKVKNIIYIRSKGYDALILIDGDRRTGKSTLAKVIAYLLDPFITINNYVAGLEESPEKIEKAKDESVLIFDEGSLVANSKDAMKRKNVQLGKIIDVCGVKKLTLIFCMPSFFSISRDIAVNYSRFLLHVYTDDRLNRGRFAYFGKKKKKGLYTIGKKSFESYAKPRSDWTGRFVDFHVAFEKEYMKLKRESFREALDPNYKPGAKKPMTELDYRRVFVINFKKNSPDIAQKIIWNGFGISKQSYYNYLRGVQAVKGSKSNI